MINDYKEWADINDFFNSFIENECVIGKEYKIGCKALLDNLNQFAKDNGGNDGYKILPVGEMNMAISKQAHMFFKVLL